MTALRRIGLAAGLIVLVSLIAVGVLTGVLQAGVGKALTATGLRSPSSPVSTLPPGSLGSSSPTPSHTPAGTASGPATSAPAGDPTALTPVLAPVPASNPTTAGTDAGVDKKKLAARIAAVDTTGFKATIGAEVTDLATGAVVYDRNGNTGFTPASTNKLLTTTTALDLLGPEHRFQTTVVRGTGDQIILVGGGDPYLNATTVTSAYPVRPSLQQLAAATATKLKAAGTTTVTLGYDTSLFSGPSWNPKWPEKYRDQVSPVSSLWVNEGRASPYETGPRVANAPLGAAKAFAAALKKDGITVGAVSSAKAAGSAPQLAVLQSLPLNLIVERLLMLSDNDAAEVVLRQAALAARQPASFVGGQVAVQQTLTKLGVWEPAIRFYDGSGLTWQTRVPPDVIVKIVRLTAQPDHPALRPVITGLPIAGVAGSLRTRFNVSGTGAARGLARAKTGTLTGVRALAGYVRTADGATLAFDLVANDATNDYLAEIFLQRVVTAIASCGCQS